MDIWAQKSDEAARDVFSTMRGILGFYDVQTKIRQPEGPQRPAQTEKLSRPNSRIGSELGSRESLASQHSVSELGAETEPQWLLAATQQDSWPPCDAQEGIKPAGIWNYEDEKNLHTGLKPSYHRPQAQRPAYQTPRKSTAVPKVTIQVPLIQWTNGRRNMYPI